MSECRSLISDAKLQYAFSASQIFVNIFVLYNIKNEQPGWLFIFLVVSIVVNGVLCSVLHWGVFRERIGESTVVLKKYVVEGVGKGT